MSAIFDAHKKMGVEQLYNPGEDRKSVGDQTSWREDAGMKTTSQRDWALRPPIEQLGIRPVGEKMLH